LDDGERLSRELLVKVPVPFNEFTVDKKWKSREAASVATGAAWLIGNNLKKETTKKRKKQKERLDTQRPSHGRS
jgi:hypothetical protein